MLPLIEFPREKGYLMPQTPKFPSTFALPLYGYNSAAVLPLHGCSLPIAVLTLDLLLIQERITKGPFTLSRPSSPTPPDSRCNTFCLGMTQKTYGKYASCGSQTALRRRHPRRLVFQSPCWHPSHPCRRMLEIGLGFTPHHILYLRKSGLVGTASHCT